MIPAIVLLSSLIPNFSNSPWIFPFPQQIFSFFIFDTNCFISLGVSGLPLLLSLWAKLQYPLINLLIHFSTVSGFTRVKWYLTLSVILLRTEADKLFWMIFWRDPFNMSGSIWRNGEKQCRAVFLKASRLPNSSVPCRGLLFPSSSPCGWKITSASRIAPYWGYSRPDM